MNREKGEGVPDFVLMDEISENAFMDNLKLRYNKNKIYTYIGEVVVSMNPYKQIDEMYSNTKMQDYKGRQMYEVPPHVYSLSNDVYRSMLQNYENQCVIISGESGAGKTEASKVLMQYIAFCSKSAAYNREVHNIKNQLLDSNPLLEAFGNSKTLRNDNSSRFGKYMEIQFELDGTPIGGKITNYLLEKSRVVTRAKGERSFHIFYQLLAGSTPQQLTSLQLTKEPKDYVYLQLSDCVKVDSINDVADFQQVLKSMTTLGFEDSDRKMIWPVLAGILHLGNVQFSDDPNKPNKVTVKNSNVVELVAKLWEVDSVTLARVLTSRSITTGTGRRTSQINIPLDLVSSQFTRDSLAKSVYAKLFDWLIERINQKLSCKTSGKKLVIGILDIYGFEIFDNNSFEQFCINLCNEKLQQLFIELTLKLEQEEYVREGITWEPVKYFNNKIICDLIEGKPGIISLMDECVLIAESTDATFLERLNFTLSNHAHYESYKKTNDRKISDTAFRLKHYAGDVTYNVVGFLEKTKDTLFVDLVTCMQSSNNKLLQEMFLGIDTTSKKRPLTAATQFKNALGELMEILLACRPHYIRCIKPNDQKRASFFDEERVRHQVRYLGLLENVRVRRAGFCYRQKYEKFIWRYKMVCPETWPGNKGDAKTMTKTILQFHKIADAEFRFGKTKIFLRNPTTLFFFEEQREKTLPKVVTLMQSAWRGYKARQFVKRLRSAVEIQRVWRGYKVRKDYDKNKERLRKQKAATRALWAFRRSMFRKYLLNLVKIYKNPLAEKVYGKFLVWPAVPKYSPPLKTTVTAFSEVLKKLYAKWRARKMVLSLNEEQRDEMRQKVHALTIFRAAKPWVCSRRYLADYLEMDTNPLKDKYMIGVQNLFTTYNETRILFADYVNKVNPKGKVQKRAIVVTDRSLYKQDPNNYKVKKSDIPLSNIVGISMSSNRDTFVVVHANPPYRDLVLDFGLSGQERYAEFVVIIVDQVKKLNDSTIKVQFTNLIKYNNSRTAKGPGTDCSLSFQQTTDPKQATLSAFKTGKNNGNIIMFK